MVLLHTKPLLLQVSAVHQKHISSFLVSVSTKYLIILRMHVHNPQISWGDKEIMKWSSHCHYHCLQLPQLVFASTMVESPDTLSIVNIPNEYHKIREVFSKAKVSGLPPHRPYYCTITVTRYNTTKQLHLSPLLYRTVS